MKEYPYIHPDYREIKQADEILALQLGTCMRLCLNIAVVLASGFYLLFLWKMEAFTVWQWLIAITPVAIALLFFLLFYRLIKRVDRYASERHNINLASRVIWEFNKSSVIRFAVGKIATFIEDEWV
ncbi:MAG: hypothetical protein M1438_19000 [Deltaproteobacteria bacterium]|nr:hypothetical protein [Deltaproteobacteria bacterium]